MCILREYSIAINCQLGLEWLVVRFDKACALTGRTRTGSGMGAGRVHASRVTLRWDSTVDNNGIQSGTKSEIREINTLLARIQLKANAPDKERQVARALLGISDF